MPRFFKNEEEEIHARVVAKLRAAGMGDHEFFHTPNEGKVSPAQASLRKMLGVNAGVPDLIFLRRPKPTPGPFRPFMTEDDVADWWKRHPIAAALELKSSSGRPTAAQKKWLDNAAANGWATAIAYGYDEAIEILKGWGYL